jgi:hypothetical protein
VPDVSFKLKGFEMANPHPVSRLNKPNKYSSARVQRALAEGKRLAADAGWQLPGDGGALCAGAPSCCSTSKTKRGFVILPSRKSASSGRQRDPSRCAAQAAVRAWAVRRRAWLVILPSRKSASSGRWRARNAVRTAPLATPWIPSRGLTHNSTVVVPIPCGFLRQDTGFMKPRNSARPMVSEH